MVQSAETSPFGKIPKAIKSKSRVSFRLGINTIRNRRRPSSPSHFRRQSLRSPVSAEVAFKPTAKMQNEEGQNMDLYIPRKCSATNRLITAKDHASVQINVGHLDENGIYTGQFTTFALCGFVRAQGDADSAVDRLWQKKKTELRQQ
ncbi:unnamed protein product [Camellia sinensis]